MTGTDLRTALNRMLWRRSGKGAWCVFCMADTGNDHEPDCPTIEVHAALAQSDRPEWMRKASRMEGTSSFPGEDGDFAKTPTVCPTCKGYRARRKIPD
jgi:hypothetical protein